MPRTALLLPASNRHKDQQTPRSVKRPSCACYHSTKRTCTNCMNDSRYVSPSPTPFCQTRTFQFRMVLAPTYGAFAEGLLPHPALKKSTTTPRSNQPCSCCCVHQVVTCQSIACFAHLTVNCRMTTPAHTSAWEMVNSRLIAFQSNK